MVNPGIRVDEPRAGFYRTKLRKGGMFVGVRIWFGPPHDPVTGEEMDRSWRWQAEINGAPADLDRVWPGCAGDVIDEREYQHLCKTQEWGRAHAPNSPQADPRRKINLLTAPIGF